LTMKSGSFSTRNALILALVLASAFWVRFAFIEGLTIDDQLILSEYDSYCHLRRAVIFSEGSSIPERDYFSAYPWGARVNWPPLHDQILGLYLNCFNSSEQSTIFAAGLFPVLLGVMTILALILYQVKRDQWTVLLFSLVALSILPAHSRISSFGYTDHHAAEVLLTTVSLLCLMRSSKLRNACITGLLLGICQLTWRGALLVVGLTGLSVIILSSLKLKGIERETWSLHGAVIMVIGALVFLIGIPLGYVRPFAESFFELSLFYVLPFILFAVVHMAQYFFLRHRHISAVLVIASGLVVITSFYQLLVSNIISGGSFLLGHHPWRDTISESIPLLQLKSFPPWNLIDILFSGVAYLFPVLILYRLYRLNSRDNKAREVILLIWAIIYMIMTLRQQRYAHMLSVPFCLISVFSLSEIWSRLKTQKSVLRGTSILLIFILLLPFFSYYHLVFSEGISTIDRISEPYYRAFAWLGENTPSPGTFTSPSKIPGYGVMNPWDLGHWLTWFGQRPCIANNFGSEPGGHRKGLEASCRFYLTTNNEEASELMKITRARYRITEDNAGKLLSFFHILSRSSPIRASCLMTTCAMRLHLFHGSEGNISGAGETIKIEGVDHFRLIYESSQSSRRAFQIESPLIRIWEHVSGARIDLPDNASPPITLEVPIITNTGRRFFYSRSWSQPQQVLFLPYATADCPYHCRAISPARVRWNNGEMFVSASEAEVIAGLPATIISPENHLLPYNR